MIWHIFKKDFLLLWSLSLAVVLVGTLCAMRTTFEGHFTQPVLDRLTFFLPYLLYLGVAVAAVTAIHQDTLCESQEDWLIRPLRRRHLALSKVLFVLLTVNVPLMMIDVLQQLVLHFPLSVSIGVAASRALIMVLLVSLPALMLGAVTGSLVHAFMFGASCAIGFVFLVLVATSTLSPSVLGRAGAAGTMWISLWVAGVVISMGSVATLAFQYATRRALIARCGAMAAVLVAMFTFVLLPSNVTLAIQQSLWGSSNSDGIRLSFDPSRPGETSEPESRRAYGIGTAVTHETAAIMSAIRASADRQTEKIALPLSISGMHPGDILVADRIDVRLVAMSGRVLYDGAGVCTRGANASGDAGGVVCSNNLLEVWAAQDATNDVTNKEQLNLPNGIYQRIKNEPVRVEVTYALTRLVARSTQRINATGDHRVLTEMGSCATRVDGDGDEVELGCLTDVGVPSCAAVVLEDPQTNLRNPELHLCSLQYGPFRRRGLEEAVVRSYLSIPFRDRSGLVHYPVDGGAIEHARIALTVYDPVGHFRTTVTVPSVRLVNWHLSSTESTASNQD